MCLKLRISLQIEQGRESTLVFRHMQCNNNGLVQINLRTEQSQRTSELICHEKERTKQSQRTSELICQEKERTKQSQRTSELICHEKERTKQSQRT